MSKVKVTISVSPKLACENLYIVGSTSSIGYWDTRKATALKYDETSNSFKAIKFLPAGETVEYKFIRSKDWYGVEKGIWNEEISNRVVIPEKGLHLELTIETFR